MPSPLLLARQAIEALLARVDLSTSAALAALHGIEGPVPRMSGAPRIDNRGSFRVGRNVTIANGPRGNPVGGTARTSITVRQGAILSIEDGAGLSNVEIYCGTSIRIGARTLIGGGVKIYDTDFHSLSAHTRSMHPDPAVASAPVDVGSDVFVGAFSIILKGVRIGDDTVIGAGALIARDIPSGEIWGGNPARFLRKVG